MPINKVPSKMCTLNLGSIVYWCVTTQVRGFQLGTEQMSEGINCGDTSLEALMI